MKTLIILFMVVSLIICLLCMFTFNQHGSTGWGMSTIWSMLYYFRCKDDEDGG